MTLKLCGFFNKMFNCKFCNKGFERGHSLGAHTVSCKANPNSTPNKTKQKYEANPKTCLNCGNVLPYELRFNKFCNSNCAAYFNNKHRDPAICKQQGDKLKQPYIDEYNKSPKRCVVCNGIIEYDKRNRKTCSDGCWKNARSIFGSIKKPKPKDYYLTRTLRQSYLDYIESPKQCVICNSDLTYEMRKRKTCSEECYAVIRKDIARKGGTVGGKVSAQKQYRRSKNEIHFADKCIEHFETVLTNKAIFNGWDADVIVEDLKIAVLWNGKWHYEKITKKHSVKQVQNRDRIKLKEIKEAGYVPYVIKDMGKFNEEFVESEFVKFKQFCEEKFGKLKN